MNVRTTTQPISRSHWGVLVAFLLGCYAIAALGGLSTASSVTGWYTTIEKPSWTPPNWLFGPVWTALYSIIGWSGWRFWRQPPSAERRRVLTLYGVQLTLNAIWSPLFFGAQMLVWGAVVIVLMALSIAALIAAGRRLDPPAAWALTPYLVWVSYASTLNIGIAVLNR